MCYKQAKKKNGGIKNQRWKIRALRLSGKEEHLRRNTCSCPGPLRRKDVAGCLPVSIFSVSVESYN